MEAKSQNNIQENLLLFPVCILIWIQILNMTLLHKMPQHSISWQLFRLSCTWKYSSFNWHSTVIWTCPESPKSQIIYLWSTLSSLLDYQSGKCIYPLCSIYFSLQAAGNKNQSKPSPHPFSGLSFEWCSIFVSSLPHSVPAKTQQYECRLQMCKWSKTSSTPTLKGTPVFKFCKRE